ncbi:MAG: chromate transporter [Eubacteriales bacterium]|nr:chromate transporter [Eubacteriales bacterium]
MRNDILKLTWEFFKAGLLGYGGGTGIVQMLENSVISNEWMTKQEFSQAVTISYSLPGPVATQLAGVIGNKVAGWLGALVSVIAAILPSLTLMFLCVWLYEKYKDFSFVKGMMTGIKPVVFAIILLVALNFAKVTSDHWITAVLFGLSFICLYYFKISPAWMILLGIAVGGLFIKD